MTINKPIAACAVVLLAAASFAAGFKADHKLRLSSATVAADHAGALAAYPGASASTDPGMGLNTDLTPLQLFWRVLTIVEDHYVEDIDPFNNTKMAHGAVRYMVASLGDSNSRFLEKTDVVNLTNEASGVFEGIGVVVRVSDKKLADYTDQQLTVVTATPSSPADKAGLITGDVIEEVASKWVMSHDPYVDWYKMAKDFTASTGDKRKAYKDAEELRKRAITLDDAARLLSSGTSGELDLKVRRAGKLIDIKVPLGRTTPDLVEYRKLDKGVAYVRVNLITERTTRDFEKVIGKVRADKATSVVLDLRGTPGGSAAAAAGIAGFLMTEDRLAYVYRPRGPKQTVPVTKQPDLLRLPVVVLVNKGTEGVSEMLAGALRDNNKAKLIGENTWGNSFERTAFPIADGSAYVLTTGKYLTPKGTNYNRLGLKPDAVVPMDPAKIGEDSDTQLQRAIVVASRPAV